MREGRGSPTTEVRRLEDLVPWEENPREDHPVEEIAASIEAFDYLSTIVVQRGTNRIVAGHGRLEALRKLGRTEVEVRVADLTDDEARAYALADNKLTERTKWNAPKLARSFLALKGTNLPLTLTGFSQAEIDEATASPSSAPSVEPGASSNPSASVTRRGDLWVLGAHRLLVGDATSREDYRSLFGEDRADLVVTDPPYGVAFQDRQKKNAIRGDITQTAIPTSFHLTVEEATTDHARFYFFGGSANFPTYLTLFDAHLRLLPRIIVWAKPRFILRHNNYHSQFELVYFGWKGRGGDPSRWYGDRKQSDLWTVDIPHERDHPTQKPLEVFERPIRNSSTGDSIVFDPFLGSGTCLIACERLGRRCYGMELDPKFADVIVKRWEAVSEGVARLGGPKGPTFAEVAARRMAGVE